MTGDFPDHDQSIRPSIKDSTDWNSTDIEADCADNTAVIRRGSLMHVAPSMQPPTMTPVAPAAAQATATTSVASQIAHVGNTAGTSTVAPAHADPEWVCAFRSELDAVSAEAKRELHGFGSTRSELDAASAEAKRELEGFGSTRSELDAVCADARRDLAGYGSIANELEAVRTHAAFELEGGLDRPEGTPPALKRS